MFELHPNRSVLFRDFRPDCSSRTIDYIRADHRLQFVQLVRLRMRTIAYSVWGKMRARSSTISLYTIHSNNSVCVFVIVCSMLWSVHECQLLVHIFAPHPIALVLSSVLWLQLLAEDDARCVLYFSPLCVHVCLCAHLKCFRLLCVWLVLATLLPTRPGVSTAEHEK